MLICVETAENALSKPAALGQKDNVPDEMTPRDLKHSVPRYGVIIIGSVVDFSDTGNPSLIQCH